MIVREALALKWATEALQSYLVNKPFTFLTDYALLQWLHRVNYSNPHILRWYLLILPF